MKKCTAFLFLLPLVIACQDDTKQLLKTIDGRWQVNTITYKSLTGQDSVATLTTVSLQFDQCSKTANNSGPTTCPVNYTANNQPFRFAYQAPNGRESLYISPANQLSDPAYKKVAEQLAGSYEIITLSSNTLVMRRLLQGSLPGYEYVQYAASK